MKNEQAEIISRKNLHTKFRQVDDITLRVRSMGDGAWREITREVVIHRPAALGLLYHPETDQILLTEEFRVGHFLGNAENAWPLQCCGGMIDDGETPEQALIREALEETGAAVIDLERVGTFFPSPGSGNEIFHTYCARIAKTPGNKISGQRHEEEEIRTHLLDADIAIALMDEGKIDHLATAHMLGWLARNRARLRKKWLDKELNT